MVVKQDEQKKMVSVEDLESLRELFKPHIQSFNYMVDQGLQIMFQHIKPVEVIDPSTSRKLRIWLDHPVLYEPQKDRNSRMRMDTLFPFECRQAKISYTGKFTADVCFQYGDGPIIRENNHFGQFPIMLKSKLCSLKDADPRKLVSHKEEASEMGGYFILNGLERVVRLLILPKRNYPMSMVRSSFSERREGYTDKAVVVRCVREDQSSVTVKLYYLHNGSARLGFWTITKSFSLVKSLLKVSMSSLNLLWQARLLKPLQHVLV